MSEDGREELEWFRQHFDDMDRRLNAAYETVFEARHRELKAHTDNEAFLKSIIREQLRGQNSHGPGSAIEIASTPGQVAVPSAQQGDIVTPEPLYLSAARRTWRLSQSNHTKAIIGAIVAGIILVIGGAAESTNGGISKRISERFEDPGSQCVAYYEQLDPLLAKGADSAANRIPRPNDTCLTASEYATDLE